MAVASDTGLNGIIELNFLISVLEDRGFHLDGTVPISGNVKLF